MISLYWKNFCCDVCKVNFPFNVEIEGEERFSLVSYTLPQNREYIVFEQLNQRVFDKRWIHILMPSKSKNKFSVGKQEAGKVDFVINDVTSSPDHAEITFTPTGKITVRDKDTMYGTSIHKNRMVLQ